MAGALIHPAAVHVCEKKHLKNGTVQAKRMVKMMACSYAPSMRMITFSGLRSSNALDSIMRTGHDFHSKVALATSVRKRKVGSRIVPKAMFERFTEKGVKAIMLAQEEARRLGHNFVGTEQILLGLIGDGTGIASKVLKSNGISLKDARVEVEKIIGRGSGFVAVEIPFTPRSKRVLELSLEEARKLGHNYIGTEHLLLGLLREGEGVAARVLENLGADPSNMRTQVMRMVDESAEIVCADDERVRAYQMEKLLEYKKVADSSFADLLSSFCSDNDSTTELSTPSGDQIHGEFSLHSYPSSLSVNLSWMNDVHEVGKQVMPMLKSLLFQQSEVMGQAKLQGASTRSCTKVHKQGIALGRSLDLTKFKNYDELVAELDELFEFHGELKNRNKNWLIVYTDIEGDMMLVGDDPWQEFCGMVCKIFIYTREKVQRMNRGTLSARGEEGLSVAEGMHN